MGVLSDDATLGPQRRRPQAPGRLVRPLTPELIGQPPAKDPLRAETLPLEARVELVRRADRWQLCQLALSLVLPLQPGEAAGLLIGDINFEKRWLEFGARYPDANFTKGRTAFVLPFPEELSRVLLACVGGRGEEPLLRSRRAFERGQAVGSGSPLEGLTQTYQAELLRQPAGAVQAEQDRKVLFRRLLRRLGGATEDALNREFKRLLGAAGVTSGATLYSLRTSVTTAMHRANLPHLEMRYLTGHATGDILNEYTSLDPVGAMAQYFGTIRPLLAAIELRAGELGLPPA